MAGWIIPILTAIGGAAVALIGKELIEWYKSPRFEIDFEKRAGQKPYTPDYNNEAMPTAGDVHRIKYLRLKVRNKGKKPAMNCEAKLELSVEGAGEEINKVALHWSRHDPALYSKYRDGGVLLSVDSEKVFAPISLNINDEDTVDVVSLIYYYSISSNTDHSPRFPSCMESISLRKLQLNPNTHYSAKVTIYSSNTVPKSFKFKINWDGTLEGFNNAFTKD